MKKNKCEHIISKVQPGSIAEEMEIEPGDVLLSINDEPIEDVFDYRYMIKDEYVVVLIRKPYGEEWELEIEKDYDDDLGLEFENDLMSEYKSCSNKCLFCFIDQMPPGMRDTLYFKDDDSRLSFLQGNYITLTNMTEKDIDRIIKMQLAPINISVQSTEPELRCKLLHNRFAGDKLKFIDKLYEGHVEMNGQIVCCKNINDGEHLRRTIEDLSKYLPFMRSVSAVPAGITKYRDDLPKLDLYTKEEAGAVIDLIESYQQGFYEKYGLHFIHASDEWYILAERDFPEEERYDGYIQLENGVGMMRLLWTEFEEALHRQIAEDTYEQLKQSLLQTITIATGKLAAPMLSKIAAQTMEAFPGLRIYVKQIRNDFFGETVTVSGLITAQDLIAQLQEERKNGRELGSYLLIPSNMLRTGEEVFLDDLTITDVEQALSMHVIVADTGGEDLLRAMLFHETMKRSNENYVYVKAYEEQEEGYEE